MARHGTASPAKKGTHPMKMQEIMRDLRENPTVPVWPHYARLLNLSRGSAYASIAREEVEVIHIGKLVRVLSAPLRKKLGIDAA
jgi:hypothetical protein